MNYICKLLGSKLEKHEETFPDKFIYFFITNHGFVDNKNINMIWNKKNDLLSGNILNGLKDENYIVDRLQHEQQQ